jgi:hypothetical protein
MRIRLQKLTLVLCGGVLMGILPGCIEVWLLNIATPFLLNN